MAYVETDMRTVLEKAMRAIPMDSEFYTVLEFAFEACEKSATYREAWELCEEKYKHYNWVTAMLPEHGLRGDRDLLRGQRLPKGDEHPDDVRAGQRLHRRPDRARLRRDARERRRCDKKFTEPLEDRLDTYVRTMETQSITSLSETDDRRDLKALAGITDPRRKGSLLTIS